MSVRGRKLQYHVDFVPALLLSYLSFDPEDEGDMFLRNVGLSQNYAALRPRRHSLPRETQIQHILIYLLLTAILCRGEIR
jgi:hypothetical protein